MQYEILCKYFCKDNVFHRLLALLMLLAVQGSLGIVYILSNESRPSRRITPHRQSQGYLNFIPKVTNVSC